MKFRQSDLYLLPELSGPINFRFDLGAMPPNLRQS